MRKIYKRIDVVYTPCDVRENFAFGNVPTAYDATSRYITLDGVPVTVTAGEFHFSRYDCRFWEMEILKMKAQGLDCVSTYVFWNHHERRPGKFDFGGNNDINRFVSLCKRHGLKVILRIGPWCHGEVRRGGFPDYLAFVPGKRKSTPLYMHFVKRFWTALAERVKEFCDGETIFAVQLENEYTGNISHIVKLREAAGVRKSTSAADTSRAARQIFEPGKTERQALGIFIPTVDFHFRRTPVRERPKRFRALFCRAPAGAFG